MTHKRAKNRALSAGLLASVLAVGAAHAVQVPNKYEDGPVWGPRALPGDVLPPFGMLRPDGSMPAYPNTQPVELTRGAAKPETTAAGPPLELSSAGGLAALRKCKSLGKIGSVVVVDVAGDIQLAMSHDDSDASHIFVAARKALVALEFERPSIEVRELVRTGDTAVLKRITPAMFVNWGAYPLRQRGKVIGAIAYSGGLDDICAKAGADYINARLAKK